MITLQLVTLNICIRHLETIEQDLWDASLHTHAKELDSFIKKLYENQDHIKEQT